MRLALAEYGTTTELADEEPWSPGPAVFALNPAGMLPILVADDGTVVCGVEAITEYLEETLGRSMSLIPGDVRARAEVRRRLFRYEHLMTHHPELSSEIQDLSDMLAGRQKETRRDLLHAMELMLRAGGGPK